MLKIKKLKKIMLATLITSLLMMFSCAAASDELTSTATEQKTEEKVVYYENASLPLAKLAAETYLLQYETINNWENATLDEPYPLYNPATDVVTYLEYPVIKDGKRKGYIMVTLKDDEPRVVEASESSEMTNYEALAEKAGTDDIKAVRFSFASFTAEDTTVSRSGSRKVLAALGNIEEEIEIGEVSRSGNSVYEDYINAYKARVDENGGFLDIDKDVYEANKEWIEYRNGNISRGKVNTADKSPITKELSRYSSYHYTLVANQFKTSGADSGCVPTAGAIALAYYARKQNKPKLWRNCGTPDICFIENPNKVSTAHERNFISIVNELRKYLGMGYGVSGSTAKLLPSKLSYYSYKNDCGWIPYQEVYGGDSWTGYGFARLLDYLDEDNPCFLSYYDHDGKDKDWHAAVIYKATVQRDWANNYKECTYYITTGWRGTKTKSVNTWDWRISGISMQSYSYIK